MISTVLPLRSYLVVMASSAATVEASQTWEAGEVDDDVVGVVGVLELRVEVVAGGEEQLAGDAVDGGRWCRRGSSTSSRCGLGEVGDPAGEQRHRDEDADTDADGEVVAEHGDDDGGEP